jgi:rod shape-determining protein MreC
VLGPVFKKWKKPFVYLFLLVVLFLILFVAQNAFVGFKTGVVSSNAWAVELLIVPFREIKKIVFYHKTYNDYMKLRQEMDPLRQHLLLQEEALKENVRLRDLLSLKKKSLFPSLAANIIMRDPTNWAAVVIIDKGYKHGVRQGMPVVTPLGVVGKIAEVGERISKVTLLTDPRFSVAASIERTREQGLVSGTLRGVCRMQYLSSSADIKAGDAILTSKISSFFPPGLMIGTVIGIEESFANPTLECLVKPAVALSQVEEVMIVLSHE